MAPGARGTPIASAGRADRTKELDLHRGTAPLAPAPALPALMAVLGVLTLAIGCDRAEIHSYRVAKPAGATGATGATAGTVTGTGAVGAPSANRPQDINPELPPRVQRRVTWSVPAGWKEVASEQPMRLATFDTGGAEVTLSAFPGAAGGTLANVNRWRGQIGLEAIDEAALAATVTTTTVDGVEVRTMAMTGSDGKVMLAGILAPGDGQTWFVKSTTDAATAAALRPAFEEFARSIRLQQGGGAASGTPGAGDSAAGGAAAASPSTPTSASPSASPRGPVQPAGAVESRLARFVPPAHWKTDAQSGGIVAAAYSAANDAGGARATATSLANDGGGDLANINRWRGQLGLPPVASVAESGVFDPAAGVTASAAGVTAVDLVNAAGSDRMIAVIVAGERATWFFKLRGAPAGVEAERAAFLAFVRSVGLGLAP